MSNRITEFLDKNILFNYLIFNIITPPFSIQWIFEIKLRLNPKKSYLTNIHKVCRHALRYSIIITQFQILIKKMKRKFIVLSFMLSFLTFVSGGLLLDGLGRGSWIGGCYVDSRRCYRRKLLDRQRQKAHDTCQHYGYRYHRREHRAVYKVF